MSRKLLWAIALALHAAPAAWAADAVKPAAPADRGARGGARPADPLANLKPYEERRYRIDMQECGKEKGVDRRLCERSVHNRAAAKSRRRGAGGY